MTERRRSSRHRRPADHGVDAARVRPGADVTVINLSAGGAFIESDRRMLPGSSVELDLKRGGLRLDRIRGLVVRCAVARLRPNAVRYRAAIAFQRHLEWLADAADADVPDQSPVADGGGADTRLWSDAEAPRVI